MSKPVQARPFIHYVGALALALVLPCLVFSAVVTWQWVTTERRQLETAARETTDALVTRVDKYLAGQIAMLQALATSPALDAGDYARFDAQARELLALQGTNIVLRDRQGQQLVNTRLPWGSALPRRPLDTDPLLLESKRPYVSDLFIGAVAQAPLVPSMCLSYGAAKSFTS
jgi:hypothetical protein